MKKILYICESIGGGVRKHILDILTHLDSTKYSISIIYSETSADEIFKANIESLEAKGIHLYSINNFVNEISVFDDMRAFYCIVKLIRNIKPDIVHCHSAKAGAIGRMASKFCRIKSIVYTPHAYPFQNNTLSNKKRKIYIFIERLLSRVTDITINVSEGERDSAIQNHIVRDDNSVVIFNGINNTKNSLVKSGDKVRIGTTMRMEPQKDPLTFIEIAKKVVEEHSNVEFVFVGDGRLKHDVKASIEKNNLQEKVKLSGFQRDVINIVGTFDIYLITSLYEGLPYSVVEAISLGKPIVATNVTGNNEIVIDGYNGLLFEPMNALQGANKISLLLSNPELLHQFGVHSRALYEEYFTIDQMLDALEKIYNNQKPSRKRIEPIEKEIGTILF